MPTVTSDDMDSPSTPSPNRRRLRIRYLFLGIVVVVVLYGVTSGLQLLDARKDLEAGSERLSALNDELHDLLAIISTQATTADDSSEAESSGTGTDSSSPMTLDEVRTELQQAASEFDQAVTKLGATTLQPLRVVPVLGRQLQVVNDLAGASLLTTNSLNTALETIDAATIRQVHTPEDRLAVAAEISTALETLLDTLLAIDLAAPEGLITPVADAWNTFTRYFTRATTGVEEAHAIAHGVTKFLSGPHDYLVLAANNAEMQAGSGMFLQVGTLHINNGVLSTGPFTPSEDLYLASAAGELDVDIARNWGWLHPNQEWRNLNLSPRFDESARMALAMWEHAQDVGLITTQAAQPAGVFALDIAGVQDLLELTGPVEVSNSNGEVETVSADSVIGDLTLGQYLHDRTRGERRERLGEISSAVFAALTERPIPAIDLISTIRSSGRERRFLIWSNESEQQAAWEALQVSGTLPANAVMLSLMNRGGNKLDPFIDIDTQVQQHTIEEGPFAGQTEFIVTVNAKNTSPEGLPRYVEGPLDPDLAVAGEYRGILMLTLPAGSHTLTALGHPLAVRGADGPNNVIGINVSLHRGESLSVVFSSHIPKEVEEVTFIPSARLPRTTWNLGPREWNEYGPLSFPITDLGAS